jgi:hypothetical protein
MKYMITLTEFSRDHPYGISQPYRAKVYDTYHAARTALGRFQHNFYRKGQQPTHKLEIWPDQDWYDNWFELDWVRGKMVDTV